MNQHVQPVELDLESVIERKTRKELMPWWVKTFGWIILVAGSLLAVATTIAIVFGADFLTNGQNNSEVTSVFFFVVAIYLFKAFVAFSLLFEKNHAILLAKIDSYVTVVLMVLNLFFVLFGERRLAIGIPGILICISLGILFLVWLHSNTKAWAEATLSK